MHMYIRAVAFDDESKASNVISREVTNFCAANGKWYLSITTLEQSNPTIAYAVNSLMDRLVNKKLCALSFFLNIVT